MPRGKAGSPTALLTTAITTSSTTISFDTSILPDDVPNLVTIAYNGEIETVWYTAKDSGHIYLDNGGIRGFNGTTAKEFPAGATVARYISEYDVYSHKVNIEEHESRLVQLETGGSISGIEDLDDMDIVGPVEGEVLIFNGEKWVNGSNDVADANTLNGMYATDFAEATHAIEHATGGSDEITPASIGAASADHTWLSASTISVLTSETFSVTDNAVNQAIYAAGRPIRYRTGVGAWDYGIVLQYDTGTVTVSGASLEVGDNDCAYADMNRAIQMPILINGLFEDESDLTLLLNDLNQYFEWSQGKAYLVMFKSRVKTANTDIAPWVNMTINGNVVASFPSVPTSSAWSFASGFTASSHTVNCYDEIEVLVTKNGNGNASDLSIIAVFVME